MACTLAWEYAGAASGWRVDQCTQRGPTCAMAQVATLPGEVQSIELGELRRNRTYCWQVRLPSGEVSNAECSD
jgi:hypothetical protein